MPQNLKVVIVGDGGCGKTSLLMVYTKKRLSRGKTIDKARLHGRLKMHIHLFLCISGREDYDRLRPVSYPNANLVLICYDVICPSSYDNVLIKWYPEVHHFCHGVPIILVGCKTDLRKDKGLGKETVQGEETKKKIKAELYLECSAKYKENVEDIFREATKQALAANKEIQKGKEERILCPSVTQEIMLSTTVSS
uniref:Ras homolog family member F, filopodia associated n=1 Tax=Oncorhynchus mykiss TaxID=8022 RepID=A0A8C7S3R6_ONCMY